ncbi:MAG: glycosyltransferase [Candidatus Omnitrophota bacterium]
MKYPSVDIITVNLNGKKHLRIFFDSVFNLNYSQNKLKVTMVDNGSSDDSIGYVSKIYPKVNIIKNDINNFCRANNIAIRQSRSDYIFLINNDTKLDKNCLKESVRLFDKDKKVAAVGSRILFMDGRLQSAGHQEFPHFYYGDRGLLDKRENYDEICEVKSISNCAALYSRRFLLDVGMLDEDYIMYMEDVDLCYRLREKKKTILYAPNSIVYHRLHGTSMKTEDRRFYSERNRLLFLAKHFPDKLPDLLKGDDMIWTLNDSKNLEILFSIAKKLTKHHKASKVYDILSKLCESVDKVTALNLHNLRNELENIKNTLSERKTKILNLEESIKEKDRSIVSINQSLSDALGHIEKLKEEILKRDKILAEQDGFIRDRDKHINNLMKSIDEKNINLAHKESEFREKKEYTANLEKEIVSKDESIKIFEKTLETREDSFKKIIFHMDDVMAKNNNELKLKMQHIDDLNCAVIAKDVEVYKKEKEIQSIYDSESFRFVVRPIIWPILRLIKKIIRIKKK